MATSDTLIARIRSELGDFAQPFRQTYRSDGAVTWFDLPATNVNSVVVTKIHSNVPTVLTTPANYTLETRNGILRLTTAYPDGDTILVEGTQTSLFTDDELAVYLQDALNWHTSGGTATTHVRYRDADGFIKYATIPVDQSNLPPEEESLVSMLATIEALWALSTDASTDVDVSTADGTFLNRSQRYAQILQQINVLTDKYKEVAQQLNVGLYRTEVSKYRRVSRTTGRYVPLYIDREWDDNAWPERQTPPIPRRYAEDDQFPVDEDVAYEDFKIIAGDSFSREIDLGIDLTGSTVAAAVRGWTVVYAGATVMTVTVTNAAAGIFTISLTPYQTAHLGSSGVYDVQVTDSAGNSTTWLRGRFWITPQVTPSGYVPDGSVAWIDPWYIPGWTNQHPSH